MWPTFFSHQLSSPSTDGRTFRSLSPSKSPRSSSMHDRAARVGKVKSTERNVHKIILAERTGRTMRHVDGVLTSIPNTKDVSKMPPKYNSGRMRLHGEPVDETDGNLAGRLCAEKLNPHHISAFDEDLINDSYVLRMRPSSGIPMLHEFLGEGKNGVLETALSDADRSCVRPPLRRRKAIRDIRAIHKNEKVARGLAHLARQRAILKEKILENKRSYGFRTYEHKMAVQYDDEDEDDEERELRTFDTCVSSERPRSEPRLKFPLSQVPPSYLERLPPDAHNFLPSVVAESSTADRGRPYLHQSEIREFQVEKPWSAPGRSPLSMEVFCSQDTSFSESSESSVFASDDNPHLSSSSASTSTFSDADSELSLTETDDDDDELLSAGWANDFYFDVTADN
ncbi:hypothetical protein DFH11DRAFT_1747908 [Phellopilus nigrolimitatus]|nr:hypothetical protein DFH11DRAFT_1747908 [Phellopilus nigrolimitatus]